MTTPTTVSVRLQLRADTAANWTSANPTLLANELGRETDTGKIKIGDGSTAWSSLAYQAWATLPIAVASGGTGQTSYTNGQLLIGNTTGNTLTKATLTAGSGIAITNGTGSITVAASGISDAQIAADAEIAVSKLADGTARQLLQTDAAGTGVEWASNIDIPGTLDVTSAATFDSTIGASAGTASLPSITFTGDLNTGIYSPGADQVAISTNGVERVEFGTSEVVFNDGGANYDFRVEGDTNANLFFVDASAEAVGIGTSSPQAVLESKTANVQPGDAAYAKKSVVANIPYATSNVTSSALAVYDGTIHAADIGYSYDGTGYYLTLGTNDDTVGSPTERLRIDRQGRVGIGTTSPQGLCDVAGSNGRLVLANGNTSGGMKITAANAAYNANGYLAFEGYSSEYGRFDSSGRLLVGTSTARTNFFNGVTAAAVQIEGSSTATRMLSVFGNTGDAFSAGVIILGASRGTSAGSNTIVQNGDELGVVAFQGTDGSEPVEAARITAFVDGTPGANDMPGRLVFSTTADGASSPTEQFRVNNQGSVLFGTTDETPYDSNVVGVSIFRRAGHAQMSRDANVVLAVNRKTDDGTLVNFGQDGTTEGSISVSGTTVSYNGAHLSRWSQLPSGAEREDILRGTVLSNIDEMCEWGEEDNEQLNRMKVSDVEGDKNVSGVFQAWDDDDDTYTDDFYCAMTGDFIIRIAEGVTVERGDLLMSAGDGTAKPQDDDIIRSKTIAKVTSTNVSCTYEDGSYCVPCVLMAC